MPKKPVAPSRSPALLGGSEVDGYRPNRREVISANKKFMEKVLHSPVLNGGFVALMAKVDGISERQNEMIEKVNSIHDAIYDPNQGLFARVKTIELTKASGVEKLEKDVMELQMWKSNHDESSDRVENATDTNTNILEGNVVKVNELMLFRERVHSVMKWFAVTLVGGSMTLVGKLIYDLVSGHIHYS